MPAKSMKKLSIIIARQDTENVIRELIRLGCVELSEPDILAGHPELEDAVTFEKYGLEHLNANKDAVLLLGTRHTQMLTGWVPARFTPALQAKLEEFICAWEISDLTQEEAEAAPVKLLCPGFFKKQRLAGRRLFDPLCLCIPSAGPPANDSGEEANPQ